MYILGDIGNSETKVFLVNKNNKILKKIFFVSKPFSVQILKKKFKILIKDYKDRKNIIL